VRLYGLPTPFANLCSKVKRGQHGETCTVNKPWNGTYWVGVYGYTDFSKLRLVAKY